MVTLKSKDVALKISIYEENLIIVNKKDKNINLFSL